MKRPLSKLLQLFLSFLKIGAFTFGGGYAMIALLENEFVSKKAWLGKDEFLDILAVSESTPGPIAVNTATYIGYKVGGVLGAALSTLAVCLPSFVVIFAISLVFDTFLSLEWVGYAFRGIQVAVVYLIARAGLKIVRGLTKKPLTLILFSIAFVTYILLSLFAVKFSTIFYILIGGTVGVAAYLIGLWRARAKASTETGEKSDEDGDKGGAV